jgi:hypothetical protein
VQYVDRARNTNGIDATERVAAMVDHDLHDARTAKALKRLGVAVLFARLRDLERITQIGLHSSGHGPKVPPGRSDPDHRLEVHILNHSIWNYRYSCQIAIFGSRMHERGA